jgi:hypothetical protein
MDNSEKKPLVKNKFLAFLQKEKPGWLKQLILSFEISTTVFSFLVLMFQFALAVSYGDSSDQLIATKSYRFIMDNIINYEIMYNITIVDPPNENSTEKEVCLNDSRPYKFKQITAMNNTCIEIRDDTTVLRFDKRCTDIKTFTETKTVSRLYDKLMCYQTFPKNYFVYYFKPIIDKCNLGDFTCGQTKTMLICLKSRKEIIKCPLIDFSLLKKQEDKDLVSHIIGDIPDIGNFVAVKNYTTTNHPFLSFKITLETYNEINFYQFYDANKEIFSDVESAFKYYYERYYGLSDYIELNENFRGTVSNSIDTLHDIEIYTFFKKFNISESDKMFFLYQTISADKKTHFRISRLSMPTDECIQHFFIEDSNANDRGLFSVLSDLSFDYLNNNMTQYVTWNFIQISAFFVFSFAYRVISLSGKINKTLAIIDKRYEKFTLITLKMFYYVSLTMKYIIIFNVNIIMNKKLEFIKTLTDKKCFAAYSAFDTRESLLHLNLLKLYKEPAFDEMKTKFSLILYLTLIEIANEGMSIAFIALDVILKIL